MSEGLSKRLIEARSDRGMSQLDLASETGVAAAQISRYESGRSRPRTEVLARLARGLHVPLDWLLNGKPIEDDDGLSAFRRTAVPWRGNDIEKTKDRNLEVLERPQGRPKKSFIEPINVPHKELLDLALQLSNFHAERSALLSVRDKAQKIEVATSFVRGIELQLNAVEADITDTQDEIRKLLAE